MEMAQAIDGKESPLIVNESEAIRTKESEEKPVEEINGLLRKAFGRNVPFFFSILGNVYSSGRSSSTTQPFLGQICKTSGLFCTQIGYFPDFRDSSFIVIDPEESEGAKRYAELYEAKYGKKVTVELDR